MTARVDAGARVCEGCDAEFERRRFPNGRLEQLARFVDRRFCSRDCYRKAAAEGFRIQPPGSWFIAPHQLKPSGPVSGGSDPRLAVVGRYPWDRQRAPRPVPLPGPFQAERQAQLSEPDRREAP